MSSIYHEISSIYQIKTDISITFSDISRKYQHKKWPLQDISIIARFLKYHISDISVIYRSNIDMIKYGFNVIYHDEKIICQWYIICLENNLIYQDFHISIQKPIYRRYIILRELFSELKYDNPIYQRYISDIKVIFHRNYKSIIYDISIFEWCISMIS